VHLHFSHKRGRSSRDLSRQAFLSWEPSSSRYIDNFNVALRTFLNEWGRDPPPGRLIDDGGAKRKVRPLIANIGNYAALSRVGEGLVGICQALSHPVGLSPPLPFPPPAFIPSGLGRQRRRGPMIATTLCFETARPTGGSRVLTQISIKLALKHFPPFLSCPASRSIQRGRLRNWRLHRGTSNCSDFRRGRRRRRRRQRRRRRASSTKATTSFSLFFLLSLFLPFFLLFFR